MKQSWRDYYMELAATVARKSKDPSTQVGCVLVGVHNTVLSTGYNGLARKVQDLPERYTDRELKLKMIVHAEANAIAAAASTGVGLYACTAFITFPPCPQCAALLIQAGVYRIVCPPLDLDSRWYPLNQLALEMCREAGVKMEVADGC
jgi:dCMP deaminase